MGDWPTANQAFYKNFRYWLTQGGYSPSSLNIYEVSHQPGQRLQHLQLFQRSITVNKNNINP